tara:strand:+ start:239 stop:982 length:744 start_codon:yes stop_codon:yes gene_type:complete
LGILITLIATATIAFFLLRKLLAKKNLSVRSFFIVYGMTLIGISVLFLALTGRLHPLFAIIGASLPFLTRIIGLVMRGVQFASVFRNVNAMFNSSSGSSPDHSEIRTEYLHMRLDHASGKMEGIVLRGTFETQNLSKMSLDDIRQFLEEIKSDADSLNLMHAYLERERSDWNETRAEGDGGADVAFSSEMSETQALEILGLSEGASKEEVITAHKRLMQRVHPDRGGSTYLAAKINAAKDLLTNLYS